MVRLVRAAAVVTLCGAGLSAAQNPPVPFAPPVGYVVGDAADVTEETVDFSTGPLARESVRGRRWQVFYEAIPGARRRPIAITRHYLTQVEARGGSRLFGYMGEGGGQVWAHVPGPKPLWLQVAAGNDGDGIELTVVEELSPRERRLPVPAERLDGRWRPDVVNLAAYPASFRPTLQRSLTEVSALLRAVPLLAPPAGAAWAVVTGYDDSVPERGPVPLSMAAIVLLRFQDCASCPVHDESEGRRMLSVEINRPETAVVSLSFRDPAGRTMFEWRPEQSVSADITRTRGGHLVMTRPGRPPLWLPVSHEAYIRAQLAEYSTLGQRMPDMAKALAEQEQALRELEKTDPAAAKEARAALRAAGTPALTAGANPAVAMLTEELNGLSPEDRRKPAALADGATIVVTNPAYDDPALPRTAAQVIVVRFESPQDYFLEDVVDRLKPLDWSGLMRLFR